jgi:hypothetical protein
LLVPCGAVVCSTPVGAAAACQARVGALSRDWLMLMLLTVPASAREIAIARIAAMMVTLIRCGR